MTEIYLIRHGSTELNGEDGKVDRIRGWTDVPLSAKGRQDAVKLGKQLASSGIKVIFYSTLERAKDTAEAIAKTTGAPLIAAPMLRPWNVGVYTGQDSSDAHPALRKFALNTPDKAIPEGESFNDFKNRVLDGLGEILEKAGEDLPAVVTHHRVERLLASWIKAGQPADRSVDLGVMFQKGEPTGHSEKIDINEESLTAMPSHSVKQAKTMSAIAHGWKPSGKAAEIPVSVAKEFHQADKGKKYGAKGKAKPHQLAKALAER